MFYGHFDSYTYSRPVAYRSYNTRLTKPEILTFDDPESNQVVAFLKGNGYEVKDLGSLHRGIRFNDLEVGKRQYNHHSPTASTEYYIHQWKSTNDMAKWHPTGTHLVFKSFPEMMDRLARIVQDTKPSK